MPYENTGYKQTHLGRRSRGSSIWPPPRFPPRSYFLFLCTCFGEVLLGSPHRVPLLPRPLSLRSYSFLSLLSSLIISHLVLAFLASSSLPVKSSYTFMALSIPLLLSPTSFFSIHISPSLPSFCNSLDCPVVPFLPLVARPSPLKRFPSPPPLCLPSLHSLPSFSPFPSLPPLPRHSLKLPPAPLRVLPCPIACPFSFPSLGGRSSTRSPSLPTGEVVSGGFDNRPPPRGRFFRFPLTLLHSSLALSQSSPILAIRPLARHLRTSLPLPHAVSGGAVVGVRAVVCVGVRGGGRVGFLCAPGLDVAPIVRKISQGIRARAGLPQAPLPSTSSSPSREVRKSTPSLRSFAMRHMQEGFAKGSSRLPSERDATGTRAMAPETPGRRMERESKKVNAGKNAPETLIALP
ncbi:hypothetical protein C7M84_008526 [Penaeus vannamei]|uniref:Uncharacterized protein n=1 Tax=Penaeus vannamei TaxID=6689 RepID=A0A3R7M653_PENVA|nr:hypothetical protein C7M84_008526 [Penaeus vannamei]